MSTIQNNGANPYLQLNTYASQGTRQAQNAEAGQTDARATKAASGDSLELSAAARAAVGGVADNGPIEGIPPLSDSRLNEIRDRISSGYYSQPEVLAETAARVAGAVVGD